MFSDKPFEFKKEDLNPQFIRTFQSNFVKKHHFLPYTATPNSMDICVAQRNIDLESDLKIMYPGVKFRFHIISESIIESAISEIFDGRNVLDELNKIKQENESNSISVIDMSNMENEAIARQFVSRMIKDALIQDASDIHINPYEKEVQVVFRIDGTVVPYQTLNKNALNSVLTIIKLDSKLDITEKRKPQDGSYGVMINGKQINLRVATICSVYGEKCTIRVLNDKTYGAKIADILGAKNAKKFEKIIRKPYGILMLTGPTGSGKSTTLYAALRDLNNGEKTIITIEDPCEYKIDGIIQTEVNQKIGVSFSAGLRSILRQDPDVILIGEVRDGETAEIAMRAAGTGHLVLTTLHANDSISAISQIKDMGIESYMVGATLIGIVNQRLVRKVCPKCAHEVDLPPHAPERAFFGLDEETPFRYTEGAGCPNCNGTGFKGRILLKEILMIEKEISSIISSGKNLKDYPEVLAQQDFKTVKDDGFEKIKEGQTTFKEVLKHVF